jgi:hypothetical protein
VFDSAGQDPPPAAIAACNYERTRRLHITLFRSTSSWVVSSVLIPSLPLSTAKHESFKFLVSPMTTNTGLTRHGGQEDQCLHPDWQKQDHEIRTVQPDSYFKARNSEQKLIKPALTLHTHTHTYTHTHTHTHTGSSRRLLTIYLSLFLLFIFFSCMLYFENLITQCKLFIHQICSINCKIREDFSSWVSIAFHT